VVDKQNQIKEEILAAPTPEEKKLWRSNLAATKAVEDDLLAFARKRADVEFALKNHANAKDAVARLRMEMDGADAGNRFVIRQKLSALLKTFISQIRFDGAKSQITVILHEAGLINYLFQTCAQGSAPKKNPMRLLKVVDHRKNLGARPDGCIDPAVFTTDPQTGGRDVDKALILDRLVESRMPAERRVSPADLRSDSLMLAGCSPCG
jgi:hypothetical protein